MEDYSDLEARINVAQTVANESLATAMDLNARANELNAEANRISLQDLNGTLDIRL